MRFPKMYISGAPIDPTGLGMLSSLFVKSPSFFRGPSGARALRGLDNTKERRWRREGEAQRFRAGVAQSADTSKY